MSNIKDEIGKKAFDTLVVILSGLLIFLKISLFSFFFGSSCDPKIIWTLDMAVFSLIIYILLKIIYLYIVRNRTEISLCIKNKREDIDKITLESGNPGTIYCKINLKGKKGLLVGKAQISFPDWVTFQLSQRRYLSICNNINGFEIDLSVISNSQNIVDIQETILISLISNSPLPDLKAFIKTNIDSVSKMKIFTLKIHNEGILLINKGE